MDSSFLDMDHCGQIIIIITIIIIIIKTQKKLQKCVVIDTNEVRWVTPAFHYI